MTKLDRELYALGHVPSPAPSDGAVERAVSTAKREFYAGAREQTISYFDFLLMQLRTVQKRWWFIQAGLLFALWCLLPYPKSLPESRRLSTAIAPLFTIAALPELWKNMSSNSTEVEGASYFSLRGIYSARLTLFAAVDMTLLSIFCAFSLSTGRILLELLISELLLPFTVSCCICFRVLCSGRFRSEALAVGLCMVFTVLWSGIVLREELYVRVSMPVWALLLLLCAAWLVWCVRRTLNSSMKWSEPVWN
ncbi:MAG: hypothetical protein NC319_06140 [Butyricicoccus sp.]|nr:hypothetical protein [Butyricicoccus sp.]